MFYVQLLFTLLLVLLVTLCIVYQSVDLFFFFTPVKLSLAIISQTLCSSLI